MGQVMYIPTSKSSSDSENKEYYARSYETNVSDKFGFNSLYSNIDRNGNYGDGFTPKVNEKSTKKNYSTDRTLSGQYIDDVIMKLNKTVHLQNIDSIDNGIQSSFTQSTKYYNRFKVANPNTALQKGFAHIFFVRPDCNLLKSKTTLLPEIENHELFYYAWHHSEDLIRELVLNNGTMNHDFMFSLSNAAASFSPNDEYINVDSYGRTFTGYKIAYGKNNTESKTAGTFNITFKDDRNLHIYQLHRLWVEYINAVYRGLLAPKTQYVFDKILDYATCCYYIVTAEDGETIIFWSKYYGVFPTTIPVGQYSWAEGNVINQTSLDITYQYSFKEDFNPYSLTELNYNSHIDGSSVAYIPTFDQSLGHVGRTWVGAPFIELVKDGPKTNPYHFKLRYKKN